MPRAGDHDVEMQVHPPVFPLFPEFVNIDSGSVKSGAFVTGFPAR